MNNRSRFTTAVRTTNSSSKSIHSMYYEVADFYTLIAMFGKRYCKSILSPIFPQSYNSVSKTSNNFVGTKYRAILWENCIF